MYVSKTKAGKKTDDPSKIVKVEGELYPSRGIVEYDALSEIAILLEEQKELSIKLEKAKEDVRVYMEDLFDLQDKLYTRVLKITRIHNNVVSELKVTMTKETERTSIDYKAFINELKETFVELSVDIDILLNKYTSITKIAAGIRMELNELNEPIVSTIKASFKKLISYFEGRFKLYDKFINKYKKYEK